jgi:hypothetical protein
MTATTFAPRATVKYAPLDVEQTIEEICMDWTVSPAEFAPIVAVTWFVLRNPDATNRATQ